LVSCGPGALHGALEDLYEQDGSGAGKEQEERVSATPQGEQCAHRDSENDVEDLGPSQIRNAAHHVGKSAAIRTAEIGQQCRIPGRVGIGHEPARDVADGQKPEPRQREPASGTGRGRELRLLR